MAIRKGTKVQFKRGRGTFTGKVSSIDVGLVHITYKDKMANTQFVTRPLALVKTISDEEEDAPGFYVRG